MRSYTLYIHHISIRRSHKTRQPEHQDKRRIQREFCFNCRCRKRWIKTRKGKKPNQPPLSTFTNTSLSSNKAKHPNEENVSWEDCLDRRERCGTIGGAHVSSSGKMETRGLIQNDAGGVLGAWGWRHAPGGVSGACVTGRCDWIFFFLFLFLLCLLVRLLLLPFLNSILLILPLLLYCITV